MGRPEGGEHLTVERSSLAGGCVGVYLLLVSTPFPPAYMMRCSGSFRKKKREREKIRRTKALHIHDLERHILEHFGPFFQRLALYYDIFSSRHFHKDQRFCEA